MTLEGFAPIQTQKLSFERELASGSALTEYAEFGKYFKFVNRENPVKKYVQLLHKLFTVFKTRDNSMQFGKTWWHIACTGAPGIGKSTFMSKALYRAVDLGGDIF